MLPTPASGYESQLADAVGSPFFPAVETLTATGFSKRFGSLAALSGVTLEIRRGEIVGLIGPNGSGKTTLLDSLAGMLSTDGGAMTAGDHEVARTERSQALFYLPDHVRPWGAQRVGWTLELAEGLFGGSKANRDRLIERLSLERHLDARLETLSKGEHRRAMLAIALNTPQPFLLLDEPFDGLDLRQTREVMALLREHARDGTGRGILVSIHQLIDAARVSDRLVLLDRGGVVAAGTLDELRAKAALPGASLEDVFLALA